MYHKAIGPVRALDAGTPSAHEALMNMLGGTEDLDHQGRLNIELEHLPDASQHDYVLRVARRNFGKPQERTMSPREYLLSKRPASNALIVGAEPDQAHLPPKEAGDALFAHDARVLRYLDGSVRWATAVADSVAGNQATRLHPTVRIEDDEFGWEDDAVVSGTWGNPGIKEGTPLLYLLMSDGTPAIYSGAPSGLLKIGTALENARQVGTQWTASPGYQQFNVRHNLTGETDVVRIAHSPYGMSPNVLATATLAYATGDDGNLWMVSDYSDLPVGSLVAQVVLPIWAEDNWPQHTPSQGRLLPHYLEGEQPYPVFLGTGGTISHVHCDHEFTLDPHSVPSTCVEVVTGGTANFDTCVFTLSTSTVCVFGGC